MNSFEFDDDVGRHLGKEKIRFPVSASVLLALREIGLKKKAPVGVPESF